MAKAKTIAKAKTDKPAKHPDAELIEACMKYAIALRGMSGAFEADPTGECDFANRIDSAALRKAEKQCALAADYRPSTLDGLRAKSAAVQVGLALDQGSTPQLLQSLVDDIARFHKAIVASKSFATDAEIAP